MNPDLEQRVRAQLVTNAERMRKNSRQLKWGWWTPGAAELRANTDELAHQDAALRREAVQDGLTDLPEPWPWEISS